jgi:excinuclease ABC subunit C
MSKTPPTPETPDSTAASLTRGIDIILAYVKNLPERPGVYRMIGHDKTILYVGKAKSLKKRVISYTQPERLPLRLQRMVSLTHFMEFVETHTEAEALLLEANLIKGLDPVYNVLLKDDKMYPYILIPRDHDTPGVIKYRGARNRDGYYYGPFLSGGAVSDTITVLHKVFQLRNCTDSYFAARKRPCLQYHIKRCTAPCVGKVSVTDYQQQVHAARDFLEGRSRSIQDDFAAKMQTASATQDYETAANYRDRIKMLTSLLSRQDINITEIQDADVMAIGRDRGTTAIQVFFFRAGQNYGNLSYFPRHADEESLEAVLSAFMTQFYADKPVPDTILLNLEPDELPLIQEAFSGKAGHKVEIMIPQRGARKRVLDFAVRNMTESIERHLAERATAGTLLQGVQTLFNLDKPPQRIEVYDNSHLGGTGQIGAMIVAGPEGFRKNSYRKFNIKTADASDDYGMMREVMTRRFSRALSEDQGPGTTNWPDLLLIDGGQGQLTAVTETLIELGVMDDLNVVAISKGPDRNAGREFFHQINREPFQLPINDPVLHYLQRLRDESHRFVIGSQRQKRIGGLTQSLLDTLPGIGPRRKKALLLHFGSAKAVADAGLTDLEKVEGISKGFAKKIYDHFHGGT